MEVFHFAVLTVAIVFFIIIIISFSILLSYKRNNIATYPPTMNTCPDYWDVATDVSGCKIKGNINIGNLKNQAADPSGNTYNITTTPSTFGLKGNNTINFADSAWSTNYSSTNHCALKTWSNRNNIVWDGVSNYNSC